MTRSNGGNQDIAIHVDDRAEFDDNGRFAPYPAAPSSTRSSLHDTTDAHHQRGGGVGAVMAAEHGGGFLSCSPMVSVPRTNPLRLPDLDLREARRAAAMMAGAARGSRMSKTISARCTRELCQDAKGGGGGGGREGTMMMGGDEHHRRSRSRSLGSACEKQSLLGNNSSNGGSNHSIGYLSREASTMGGESTKSPSILSLMNLGGYNVGRADDREEAESDENGNYGSTAGSAIRDRRSSYVSDEDGTEMSVVESSEIPKSRKSDHDDERIDIDDDPLLRDLRREFRAQTNPPTMSLLYGLINTSIVLPIVMSFGSIIYRDDFFRPYLSGLIQLTIVSGAVHQISFSAFSSLPFAVGSVQDAGLIFLSSMASNLVARLRKDGADDATVLATVTIGLSVYTAVLGCALILVGRFRLASYCKLLPTSVVGGYLGYIGFFCGQAGLALMAEVDVSGLTEWGKFLDVEALTLMTPGVIGGCSIYYSVRTFRHMAVLPTCIVMLMVIFYGVLRATGTSVRDATKYGWINKNFEQSPAWYHTWEYLKIEKVVWTALPSQALTLVAMICVVSLSSSLDIAAIEIELGRPLDYNHELKTVGFSNIVSGLTGGYTGSYIFSQSIFSLKMGIRSRLMGYSLAFFIMVFWIIPFNILCYVPNFFFGSLLLMICLDLMFEWLIDVRKEITSAEYVTVLATFALLQMLGLEFGIITGCILHVAMRKMGFDMGNDEKVNEADMAIANYKTTFE